MRTHLALVATLAIIGCNSDGSGDTGKAGTTSETTEPGTTPPGQTYEPGCILVDGAGGYAYLADAIEVASDGSTITLCNGVLDQSAEVIGKTVSIEGLGVAATEWIAPTNEIPITVGEGGNVTVSDVRMTSTRSGALVEGGQLVLDTVDMTSVGTYGVEVRDGDLVATELSILDAPWGGIFVSGGTIDVDGAVISGSKVAGILMESGSIGTVTNTTITDTEWDDDGSGYITNGVGIHVFTDATLIARGNTYHNNFLAGVYVEGGSAEMTNDLVSSDVDFVQYVGVFVVEGDLTATDSSIETGYQYGILSATGNLTLDGTDIIGEGELSYPSTNDGLGNITLGSVGLYAIDMNVMMFGGTISNWLSAGAFGEASQTTVALSFDGTLIDSNWERGVYVYNGSVDAVDTVITNTFSNDPVCEDPQTYSVSCNMAMFAIESDVTYTGGRVQTNEMWGLTALLSVMDITGTTFSDNGEIGLFAQDSVVTVDNGEFVDGNQTSLYLNGATGVIQNSTFSNAAHEYTYYGWDAHDPASYYTYYIQAWDIQAYSGDLVVDNTSFADGERGIYFSGGTLDVTDTTFTGMKGYAVYGYDADMHIEDVVAENTASDTFYCYLGSLELSDVTVSDTTEYQTDYAYYYGDGTYSFGYTGGSAGSSIDGSDCDYTLEDVDLIRSVSEGIYIWDSSLEADGLNIQGGGGDIYTYAAIDMTWYDIAPDVELTDVTVTGTRYGSGVEMSNYSGLDGLATMTDIKLGVYSDDGFGLPGYGIYADSVAVDISGLEIADVGDSGIRVLYADGSVIDGATAASTGEIITAGDHGIELTTASATIQNVRIVEPGLAGLSMSDGTNDLGGVEVSSAGTYGMECTGTVTFGTCDAILSGALGESNGCPACTGAAADTGVDTGL